LKKTFSPEAQMVAAISFVELCQFPSAIKTVDQFKESYRSTYQWLYQWEKAGPNSQSLYDLSVDYLQASTQTKGSSVPDAIGTEWIRSNHFLAGQEEINLLLRSQKRIRELKEELKVSQLPSSKALAQNLENFERGVPERIQTLTGKIHSALARRTSELLKQLSEVAANNAMIEIEAYQGISKEIQFRKGVAEFDALAERVKKSDQLIAQAPKKASTWDWGRSPASTGPGVEIWEDELGMLRAKTLDRCKELAQIKENSEQSR
jgi:hypothetical protein